MKTITLVSVLLFILFAGTTANVCQYTCSCPYRAVFAKSTCPQVKTTVKSILSKCFKKVKKPVKKPKKPVKKPKKKVPKKPKKKVPKKPKKPCSVSHFFSKKLKKCVRRTCPKFFKFSKKVKRCIKKARCPKGQRFNLKTKKCYQPKCAATQVWSKKEKKCVAKKCAKGQKWNVKQKRCVSATCPKGFYQSKKTKKCMKKGCKRLHFKKVVRIIKKRVIKKVIKRKHKIIKRLKKSVECSLYSDPHLKAYKGVRKEAQTAGDWVLHKGPKLFASYRGVSFGKWVALVDWIATVNGNVVRSGKLPSRTVVINGKTITLKNNVKHSLGGTAFVLMNGKKTTVSTGDGEDIDFVFYTKFWNAYARTNVVDVSGLCAGQFVKSKQFAHPHAGKILPPTHIGKHCKKQKQFEAFCKKTVKPEKVRNCVFDLCAGLPKKMELQIIKERRLERRGHIIKIVKVVKVGKKHRVRTLAFKRVTKFLKKGNKKIQKVALKKIRHGKVFKVIKKIVKKAKKGGKKFKKVIKKVIKKKLPLKLKFKAIKQLKKLVRCDIFADPHVNSNGRRFEAQVAGEWLLYEGKNLKLDYRGKSFGRWVGIVEWIAKVRGAIVRSKGFNGVTVNGKPVVLKNGVRETLPNGGYILMNGKKITVSTNDGEEADFVSNGSNFNVYIRTNFASHKGVCAKQFIKSTAFKHVHPGKPIKPKKCKNLKKITLFCKGKKRCIFDLCAGFPKKMEKKIQKEVRKEEKIIIHKKVKGCGVKLCKAPLKFSASKNKCIRGKCPQFFKWSKKVNRCIKLQRCKKGFSFSLKKGKCLTKKCPVGQRFSKKQKKCVAKKCAKKGERWNKKQKKCTFRRCPKGFFFNKKSNKCTCPKKKKIIKKIIKIIKKKIIKKKHEIIKRLKKSVQCTLTADPHLRTVANQRKEAQTAGDWELYKGMKLEAHYRGKSMGRWVGIVDWLVKVNGVVVRNSKLPARTITVDGKKVTLKNNVKYNLKNGGYVLMVGNKYTITTNDGEDVDFLYYTKFWNAYVRTNIPKITGLCAGQFIKSKAFKHPHAGKILPPQHIGNCKNRFGYQKTCKKLKLTGAKLRNCIFDLCQKLPKKLENEFIKVGKKERKQHVHQSKKFKIVKIVKKVIVKKGKKILKKKVTKRHIKKRFIPPIIKRKIIQRLKHSVKCQLYADPHALGVAGNRFEAQTEGDWLLYQGVDLILSYRGKRFGGWVGVVQWIAKVKGAVVRNNAFTGVTVNGKPLNLVNNVKQNLPNGGWVLKVNNKITISTNNGEEADFVSYNTFFNVYVRTNVPIANINGICAKKFVKSTEFNHPQPGKIDKVPSLKNCKNIKQNRAYCGGKRKLKGVEFEDCVFDLCQKLPKDLEKRILHRNHVEIKKKLTKKCKLCGKKIHKLIKKVVKKHVIKKGPIKKHVKTVIKKFKVAPKKFKTVIKKHIAHVHPKRGVVKVVKKVIVHHHKKFVRPVFRRRGRRGVSTLSFKRKGRKVAKRSGCKRRVVRNYVVALIKTIKSGLILPSTPSKVTGSLWNVALRKLHKSKKCLKCAKKVSKKCIAKVTTATLNAYKRCPCTAQNYKGKKTFAAFTASASKKCQKLCKK